MTQLAVAPEQETVKEKHGWRWVAFSAALAAMVIDRLDSTIVNVAAPSIQASLGGTFADLQWTAAAYTLAMAVTLLVGGRLGDMFGRKRILLLGVAGFTVASVLCALSTNQAMLVGFRAAQGIFAAAMLPQVFGLVRDIFPPSHQRKAWVVLGPVIGLATVCGPIVGGAIISLDLFGMGWRMVFLINLPIGVVVLLVGAWLIPRTAPPLASKRFDVLGIVLAGAGMFLLVRPLVQGSTPTDRLMLLGAIPLLLFFAWYQVKRTRSGRPSLVEPGPFKRRSFLSGIVFALSFLMALGGFVLTFSVFVQLGLSYSPLRASVATLPWAAGAFLGSAISAALVFRMGRNVIHLGLALMGGGLLWLTTAIQPGASAWDFALPLLIGGTGMGMVFVPMFDIILGGLANHEMGSASAVLKAVQQLGLSLGVAVIGTVFFGLLGAPADYIGAARWTSLVAASMIAIAFMVGYWLPKPSERQGA